MLRRLRRETAVGDHLEQAPIGSVDEHLHAAAIRVSDGDRSVEDLFVECHVALVDQLRADLLQQTRVGQFRFEPLLVDADGRFRPLVQLEIFRQPPSGGAPRAELILQLLRDQQLIRGGREARQTRHQATIFGVERPCVVVRKNPQCADRLPLVVKRDQQRLDNRRSVRDDAVVTLRVRHEERHVAIEHGAARAADAPHRPAEKPDPWAGDGAPPNDLVVVFSFENAHSGGVRAAETKRGIDELLQHSVGAGDSARTGHLVHQREHGPILSGVIGCPRWAAVQRDSCNHGFERRRHNDVG